MALLAYPVSGWKPYSVGVMCLDRSQGKDKVYTGFS